MLDTAVIEQGLQFFGGICLKIKTRAPAPFLCQMGLEWVTEEMCAGMGCSFSLPDGFGMGYGGDVRRNGLLLFSARWVWNGLRRRCAQEWVAPFLCRMGLEWVTEEMCARMGCSFSVFIKK
jgi:hypothetical protein